MSGGEIPLKSETRKQWPPGAGGEMKEEVQIKAVQNGYIVKIDGYTKYEYVFENFESVIKKIRDFFGEPEDKDK